MRIGWIGLGAMGLGMARCAARAGHQVVGHTRGRGQHQGLVDDGGLLTGDLSEVIMGADVVCINVFDEQQVRSVLYGDGVLPRLPADTTLILHTTSSPALARRLQSDAPPGRMVLDAAFSGSPMQAAAGQLSMMVGGDEAAFARVKTVLQSYASHLRHVGGLGAGMQLKLLNNLLFAAHVRLAAAAYRIAAREGFAAQTVCDVLARGSAASRALEIVGARGEVAQNIDRLRVYLDKDVKTARAAAADSNMDLGLLAELGDGFGTSAV